MDKENDLEGGKVLSWTRSTASSNGSRTAMITQAVDLILSSYRKDQFADPDGFLAQLGVILAEYPDEVIKHVSHPLTGIQRTCKFPPSLAEIVEACNAKRGEIYNNYHHGSSPLEPRPKSRNTNRSIPLCRIHEEMLAAADQMPPGDAREAALAEAKAFAWKWL
jgi:hypothetical protein